MKFEKRRKRTGISACLMIFFCAVSVCAVLTGCVHTNSADYDEIQATQHSETQAAQQNEGTVQPENDAAADVTADVQEGQQITPGSPLSPEQMAQAVDALTALLGENELNNELLQNLKQNPLYAVAEVYEALEKTTRLLTQWNSVDELKQQIEAEITAAADLSDVNREAMLAQLGTLVPQSRPNAMELLAESVQGLTQNPVVPVDTTQLDEQIQVAQQAQEDLEAYRQIPERMTQAVDALAALLSEEQQAKYAQLLENLRQDSLFALREAYTAVEKATQLLTQWDGVNEMKQQIEAEITAAADLDDETKAAMLEKLDTLVLQIQPDVMALLAESMQKLTQDPAAPVDTTQLDDQMQTALQVQLNLEVYLQTLGGISNQTAQQQAQTQTLQQWTQGNSSKFILIYLSLAIAGVGMVISIVSVVLAIRKPKAEPVDLSGTASRADAEALEQQNMILKGRLDQLERKTEALAQKRDADSGWQTALQGVKNQVQNLEARVARAETMPEPEAKPISRPTPAAPQRPAAYLRLNFQQLSPDLSVMIPDANGEYALYEDGSLRPRDPLTGNLARTNDLNGWKANGLLYAFDLEIDGVEYSAGNLPASWNYYKLGAILRPAVTKANGGNYKVQTRGCIRMDSGY